MAKRWLTVAEAVAKIRALNGISSDSFSRGRVRGRIPRTADVNPRFNDPDAFKIRRHREELEDELAIKRQTDFLYTSLPLKEQGAPCTQQIKRIAPNVKRFSYNPNKAKAGRISKAQNTFVINYIKDLLD